MWQAYKHIVPHIAVGSGVLNGVAGWIASQGTKIILAVTDPNTRRAAGDALLPTLRNAGLDVRECRFLQDEPLPDEASIGSILAAYSSDIDLILGVGAGTINDLCTYVGAKVKCPSAIVGTAPSMDGYASLGSAMLLGGVKVTPPTQCPIAIFCDTDILKNAPRRMIAAGLGDMLGKYTAMADWKLSHLLTGEPMPEEIVTLVETALQKCVKDPHDIQSITEGLILSGIAMSLYGDSRPASGTEHHLAHYWEMRYLKEGKAHVPHGIKVGLAAVAALALWKELPSVTPGAETAPYWDGICHIAKALPAPDSLAEMLRNAGAPARPSEIGLTHGILTDSVVYARDRKPQMYTLLQLLGGLGRLEDFSERAARYFEKNALSGVKCFVLDMDGTIYLEGRLFPFTGDFLDQVRENGRDFVFFTNNSSQNTAYYLNKLEDMGIPVPPEKLLMSTHVLLDWLKGNAPGRRAFVAGAKPLIEDFGEAGYIVTGDSPDFAVLGFDRDMNYPRLTALCDFARAGLPVFGVNMDYNCPVEGGYIPDCGALAAAVRASAGTEIEFFGKPSRRTLEYIIRQTGYKEEELCFVGDRLYTDIAVAMGTKARSVLVLSGETKREDLQGSPFVPDLVVEDLEELSRSIP
ncbi:MAG: iron-containing alcohol dehydrogenase [Oscillospiraceae bacterium]|jgi:glycerol-1-phosphate dehydrogenase [NAD(P)+]|nr:iron-containing alcohol dehydrogenase [Oscillospiraceae bacterium]